MSLWRRLRAALPSTLFGLVAFSFALLGLGTAAYSAAIPGLASAFASPSFGPFGSQVAESADGTVTVARDALTAASAKITTMVGTTSPSGEPGSAGSGAAVLGALPSVSAEVADRVDSAGGGEADDPDSLYPNSPAVTKEQDAEILAALLACYDDFERAVSDLLALRDTAKEMSAGNISMYPIDPESVWVPVNSANDAARRAGQCLLAADGSTYLANSRYSAYRSPILSKEGSAYGPAEVMQYASSCLTQPADDLRRCLEDLQRSGNCDRNMVYVDQMISSNILPCEKALNSWVATVR